MNKLQYIQLRPNDAALDRVQPHLVRIDVAQALPETKEDEALLGRFGEGIGTMVQVARELGDIELALASVLGHCCSCIPGRARKEDHEKYLIL